MPSLIIHYSPLNFFPLLKTLYSPLSLPFISHQVNKTSLSFLKMPLNLAVGATLSALFCVTVSLFAIVSAEDPYRFFNWNITYGDIYPLGARQRVRPQFPVHSSHACLYKYSILRCLIWLVFIICCRVFS